jgi:hypothetical protein
LEGGGGGAMAAARVEVDQVDYFRGARVVH